MDENAKVFEQAARLSAAGRRFALITVVRTAGSTPRKAVANMLIAEATESLRDQGPRLVRRHLTRDLAMCCGGEMEAFIEPLGHRDTLVLAGAGHINAALAPVALALGFDVVIADDLEEYATAERFPGARCALTFEPKEWGVPLDASAYVVVATRDHSVDQEILEKLAALGAAPAYLGVVGSQAKLLRFKKRLEARGVDEGWVARVRGPIGVDVGAETPAEIAVAVAAELIAVRRRGPEAKVR